METQEIDLMSQYDPRRKECNDATRIIPEIFCGIIFWVSWLKMTQKKCSLLMVNGNILEPPAPIEVCCRLFQNVKSLR